MMKLLLTGSLALALLSLAPVVSAGPPVPYCEPREVTTTFVGVDVENCIHVTAYVCTEPRYFGGGGGGVIGNWVCLDRAYVTVP